MATDLKPARRCYFVEFLQRLRIAQVSALLDGTECITFLGNSIFSDAKQNTAFAMEGLGLRPSTYSCLKVTDNDELHVRFKLAEGYDVVDRPFELHPKIPERTSLVLRCRFCGSLLTDRTHEFKRVLPLPSDSWQEVHADIFCHLDHCHSGTTSRAFNAIRPKDGDCLFGDDKLLVTASSLRQESIVVEAIKTTNKRTKEIVCKRCYSTLGTVFQEGECHTPETVGPAIVNAVTSPPLCLKTSKLLIGEVGSAESSSTHQSQGYWETLEDYFARRIYALSVAMESFRFLLKSDLGSTHIWVLSAGNRAAWSIRHPAGHDDKVFSGSLTTGCCSGPESELLCSEASRARPIIKLLYKPTYVAER